MGVWDGFLFGMLLQLSVGPVCLAVLQRSVTLGFRHAWWMIIGVALVDAAYMAGSIGGLALLLQIPLVKQITALAGAAILIWFGVGVTRASVVHVAQQDGGTAVSIPENDRLSTKRAFDSFLYGVVLTMTNPLTVLFWAGVFGSLMSSRSMAEQENPIGFAAGCVLSTLLFLTGISALGAYASKLLQPVWMKRVNRVVGLFLIGFALVLLIQNVWSF
ncbi:LysE family transporter [Brevibacillus choshinensis]|uniref:LysE family transporter n=1 Tax=Brevibacillus choshinensis TaxID=54911 RepID=A0ABX7FJG6_BRECH|nr:LysE family transporter [Brevibacillus choshinensis]QRG66349.1 LysE family transporter [Brevibacillus choshinensis]